jgi:hypothetical protein
MVVVVGVAPVGEKVKKWEEILLVMLLCGSRTGAMIAALVGKSWSVPLGGFMSSRMCIFSSPVSDAAPTTWYNRMNVRLYNPCTSYLVYAHKSNGRYCKRRHATFILSLFE